MMLVPNKPYSDLKDSLMKEVWNLYECHYMDVFIMMISDKYGTTFLGTGKLKQLMSLMSSLVGNRLHDNDFFSNISAETVLNEFRFTEFEKDVDFITDVARSIISTNSHVLVIVSNPEGRKFIFSTDHVKPYITSPVTYNFIGNWIGKSLYESDTDVDK